MKFECITDKTKKFTVGKIYEANTEHPKHNTTIIDDTGRKRIVSITHGGQGLRWNAGGTKFATFGKKHDRVLVKGGGFTILDENGVERVRVGKMDADSKGEAVSLTFGKLATLTISIAVLLIAMYVALS